LSFVTFGHEKAVSTLTRSLAEGRVSHAYLITGPKQVGKMTLAMDVARMVNCTGVDAPCGACGQCRRITGGLHPDVHVVTVERAAGGDGRNRVLIGIGQIQDLQREASLTPFEGRYHVFIVDGAERMSEDASNCLLKTLEEPPEQVIIVLVTSEPSAMLTTINSRCQRLDLKPVPVEQVQQHIQRRFGLDGERALELARLSGGCPGWAIEMAEQPDALTARGEQLDIIEAMVRGGIEERFAYAAEVAAVFARDRDTVRAALRLWVEWWRDVMVLSEGLPQYVTNASRMPQLEQTAHSLSTAQIAAAIESVRKAGALLERNVNPRLVLESMLLSLPMVAGRVSG
jgi:DNA polymerase-3 subunit delta'